MLRTTNDRDLARTFSRIETWEEFLTRWKTIDTEQEAIGLLHAIDVLLGGDGYATQVEPIEAIRFYLRWSRHENTSIATVSEQLVVKSGLRAAYPGNLKLEMVELHGELLAFLGEDRPTLRKPPYPRFIIRYLTSMLDAWNHPRNVRDRWGIFSEALQPHGHAFVRALCTWGLAPAFAAGHGDFPEKIELLAAYLEQEKVDVPHTLMEICEDRPPPANFSGENLQQELQTQAAHALIKLQAWRAWQSRSEEKTLTDLLGGNHTT
jgi:hypothetical protein